MNTATLENKMHKPVAQGFRVPSFCTRNSSRSDKHILDSATTEGVVEDPDATGHASNIHFIQRNPPEFSEVVTWISGLKSSP